MKSWFFTIALFALGCSAGQTETPASKVKRASLSTTLEDSAVENTLQLEAGSLKDTKVTIPAGSLAIGTELSVKKGTAPDSFAIDNSTAASSPLVIQASDSSGELGQAQEAMTLAIPISGSTSLALAADPYATLAALLEDINGNLTIWKRAKIAIDQSKAVFKSRKFGTYQLVYLGADEPDDFVESSEVPPEGAGEQQEEEESSEDSGSDDSSSTPESSDPEPTSGDPEKYQLLVPIMNNSCADANCHRKDGTSEFLDQKGRFDAMATIIATRLFQDENMPPTSADTNPNTGNPYDQPINSRTPLSDLDKYRFADYLRDAGVPLPEGAPTTIPPPPSP